MEEMAGEVAEALHVSTPPTCVVRYVTAGHAQVQDCEIARRALQAATCSSEYACGPISAIAAPITSARISASSSRYGLIE